MIDVISAVKKAIGLDQGDFHPKRDQAEVTGERRRNRNKMFFSNRKRLGNLAKYYIIIAYMDWEPSMRKPKKYKNEGWSDLETYQGALWQKYVLKVTRHVPAFLDLGSRQSHLANLKHGITGSREGYGSTVQYCKKH